MGDAKMTNINFKVNVDDYCSTIQGLLNDKFNYIYENGVTDYIDNCLYNDEYTIDLILHGTYKALNTNIPGYLNRWLSTKNVYSLMDKVITNKDIDINNYNFKEHLKKALNLWINHEKEERHIKLYIVLKVLKNERINEVDSDTFYPLVNNNDTTIDDIKKAINNLQIYR